MFFFFFQAEDGIRDKLVTGVQTCALPILRAVSTDNADHADRASVRAGWLCPAAIQHAHSTDPGRALHRQRPPEPPTRHSANRQSRDTPPQCWSAPDRATNASKRDRDRADRPK